MRSHLAPGPWLVVVALASSAAAAAPTDEALETARKAYGDLDYEACQAAAEESLELPATLPQRVDGYRLYGLCLAALGQTDEAKAAFVRMLAVDRDATLPDGLSPRFTSSYLEAKGEFLDGVPSGLEIEENTLDGRRRTLRVRVQDPAGLVDQVAWRSEDGEVHDAVRAAERMEIVVPDEVARELIALDEHGGVVAIASVVPAAPAEVPPETKPADPSESAEAGSLLTSPWLWLGVSAAGAALVAIAAAAGTAGVLLYEPRTVQMTGGVSVRQGEQPQFE